MEEHLLLCVFCFWTSRYFLPLITLFLSWSWDFPRRLLIGESPSCGSQGGGGGLQQRFSLLLSFLWTNCACSERLPPSAFSSVQSLSPVWFFVTPRTAARQASVSITNSWSLLKLMSITLVMPSNHFILCCPLQFSSVQLLSRIRLFATPWTAAHQASLQVT